MASVRSKSILSAPISSESCMVNAVILVPFGANIRLFCARYPLLKIYRADA